MREPDPLLSIAGLRHAYDGTPVLAGIDLDLQPGELMAVLGASGCGKTTLLRAVAGLLVPDAGRIELDGEPLSDAATGHHRPVEHRGVGVVFQDYALFPAMNVRANVAFGLPRRERKRADELLDLVGLASYARRRPGELSGGQQQRVALARAMAPRPQLLLLDEPFANLDASLREELGPELRDTLKTAEQSALLITHDRHEAIGLADRVAVMVPGEDGSHIGQVAPPWEIYHRPATPEIARLTGPVACIPGSAEGFHVETDLGQLPLSVDLRGEVVVLPRPHDLGFVVDAHGELEVRTRRFLGHAFRLLCDSPEGEIQIDVPTQRAPEAGEVGRLEARHGLWAVAD